MRGLLRLWGHCQYTKESRFTMPAAKVAAICAWKGDAAGWFQALADAWLIDVKEDGSWEVHDWAQHNGKMASNWENGKTGGRPKKQSEKTHDEPTNNPNETHDEPTGNPQKTHKNPQGTDAEPGNGKCIGRGNSIQKPLSPLKGADGEEIKTGAEADSEALGARVLRIFRPDEPPRWTRTERTAWGKICREGYPAMEQRVAEMEKFYRAEKAPRSQWDETWNRRHTAAGLLKNWEEQSGLARIWRRANGGEDFAEAAGEPEKKPPRGIFRRGQALAVSAETPVAGKRRAARQSRTAVGAAQEVQP